MCIVEVGGTVGDIESLPFLEAIRQFRHDVGDENVMFVHLTLMPHLGAADELKTKPTQHSVRELRAIGISPDAIVVRTASSRPIPVELKEKIALFCDVAAAQRRAEQRRADDLSGAAQPRSRRAGRDRRAQAAARDDAAPARGLGGDRGAHPAPEGSVKVALVGKYVELKDAYISINEALYHAGIATTSPLKSCASIPRCSKSEASRRSTASTGCWSRRASARAASRARCWRSSTRARRRIPFLGICFGMQLACVEFARNVCGLPDAMTTEVDVTTPDPVIDFLPEQRNLEFMGGTMRLGAYPCTLVPGTLAAQAYGELEISERHRHRYEFNNKYTEIFERNGMVFSGRYVAADLVEVIELPAHPFFLGTQAHPEYKSRPTRPAPLYGRFVGACVEAAHAQGRRPPRQRLDPARISLVRLTKDEERRIEDCFRSLPDSAPRLVYDAESTDATASVARALGADVVSRPWLGFAQARFDAAALVRTPWTFMLDADERLTPELRHEIIALEAPADVDAYSVARMNFFCGRWIRGAGWWPDRLLRLYRKGRATLESRNADSAHALHETWRVDGACLQLRAPLEHQSYATVDSYRSKFALYTPRLKRTDCAAASELDR